MKKRNQGSTMVWAIVIVMVIAVILAVTLAMANSNYQRSIKKASASQAELTAESTIETLVNKIENTSDSELVEFIPADNTTTVSVAVTTPSTLKGTIDSCTIVLTNQDDTNHITVTLSSTYNKQTYKIKAYMYYKNEGWHLDRYDGGDLS